MTIHRIFPNKKREARQNLQMSKRSKKTGIRLGTGACLLSLVTVLCPRLDAVWCFLACSNRVPT
jgi:hypothetical protein